MSCEPQNTEAQWREMLEKQCAEVERLRIALSRANIAFEKTERDLLLKQGELEAEIERLRALVTTGDFKDLYAEGLEVGKRLGSSNARTAELEAEVERLRAAQAWVADDLDARVLKAEVERLRAENARVRNEWADQSAELAKLEAENAELRSTMSKTVVAFSDVEALKARLEWFVKREHHLDWMKQHLHPDLDRGAFASRVEAMWAWEDEHPRPGSGT